MRLMKQVRSNSFNKNHGAGVMFASFAGHPRGVSAAAVHDHVSLRIDASMQDSLRSLAKQRLCNFQRMSRLTTACTKADTFCGIPL